MGCYWYVLKCFSGESVTSVTSGTTVAQQRVWAIHPPLQDSLKRYKISSVSSGTSVARDGPMPLNRTGEDAIVAFGKRRSACL